MVFLNDDDSLKNMYGGLNNKMQKVTLTADTVGCIKTIKRDVIYNVLITLFDKGTINFVCILEPGLPEISAFNQTKSSASRC